MNQNAPRVLVPPRPNPGPEPWVEDHSSARIEPAMVALLVVALVGFWAFRRRRLRAQRAITTPVGKSIAGDDSPSAKLLRLAEEVRGTLVSRFGPAMRARTTEEIAADPQVMENLGADRLDPLIRLLAEADRWKFATMPGNGREELLLQDLHGWESWHRALLTDTVIKARSQSASAEMTREAPGVRVARRPSPSTLHETLRSESSKGRVR